MRSFQLAQTAVAAVCSFRATAPAVRPLLLGWATVLGLASAPAQAQQTQQTPAVSVTQADGESLRLRIYNPTAKPTTIRVVNLSTDHAVLSETYRTPAYGTLLKFGALPAGRYALVLRVGPDRYRYTVQVQPQAGGRNTIAVRTMTTHQVLENLLASAAR